MRNSLGNIYLVVSQKCNLSCSYCYAKSGDFGLGEAFMERKTMERALEALLPLAAERCNISFFGGEPFLNAGLMEETVAFGKKIGKESAVELTFSITTNGTALNKGAIAFLKEHISYIAVSIDGPAHITDANRKFKDNGKGVYEKVIEGMKALKEAAIPFGISATVTPETVDALQDTVAHLASFGPRTLRIIPVISQKGGWRGDALRRLIEGMNSVNNGSIRKVFEGERPALAEQLFKNISYRLGSAKRLSPCAAGEGILAVSAKGDVYPCDHFIGMDGFRMGSVYDSTFPDEGFFSVQERLRKNTVEKRERCSGCEARYLCGGECHARSLMLTGDIATPSVDYCALTRGVAADLKPAILEALGSEEKSERLFKFIGKAPAIKKNGA